MMHPHSNPRVASRSCTFAASALLAGALLASAGCWRPQDHGSAKAADIFTVKRANLSISVKENANLQALRETVVRSEVEGQATVLFLVKEGKTVEQGEKLVELDSSTLLDRRTQQEITLAKAEASRIQSIKEHEILLRQNEFDMQEAKNKVTFARMDLEKFLGRERGVHLNGDAEVTQANGTKPDAQKAPAATTDGETPVQDQPATATGGEQTEAQREMGEREQKLKEAESNIQLAEADLKLAKDRLDWSKRLFQKGYITKNELEKDDLDHERKKSLLAIKKSELALLVEYTHKKTEMELLQKVEDAKVELDRVRAKNEAKLAQSEAEKKSCDAEYLLAKDRFDNYVKQVENCVIKAPTPGIVVYAAQGDGMRRQEFVQEGQQVRERQQIIVLPDVTTMRADLSVHESQIDKVAVGQTAIVRAEAIKDRVFTGKVSRVAVMADSQSRMGNPDLKVYKTEVIIDGENKDLRPSMSASVEIIVAELKDVLYVPVQAIQRQSSVTYVWKQSAGGPVATPVTIGLNDNSFVEITAGLNDGDQVFMAPPPGAVAPTFPQPDASARQLAAQNAPPPSSPNRERGENGSGPGRRDGAGGENNGEGRAQRPRSPAFTEMSELLLKKHPELAEKAPNGNVMGLLRDPDVRALIDADPELKAKYDAMRAAMNQRMGGERGAGERGAGERGTGERGRGGQGPGGQGR